MKHTTNILAFFMVIATILLIVGACGQQSQGKPTISVSGQRSILAGTPAADSSCEACTVATLSVAETQQSSNADLQAAATANIVAANAQATLNSVNSTSSALQAEQKNEANIIIAQITATAAVANANIQATLASSTQTQSAAQTQDAIQQTQIVAQATTNAQATQAVQSQQTLAAATQTTVANGFLMMTQVAYATSQWQAEQDRLQQAKAEGSAAVIWTWCMPSFIVLLGGLFLFGSWRWMGTREDQTHLEGPGERLHLPSVRVIDHQPDDTTPYIEAHVVKRKNYRLTKPDDQVGKWVDEVKREITNDEQEDDYENPGSQ